MRVFAGGREVEVPTDSNGNAEAVDVRRAANLPNDRTLILQRPSGENVIVPNRGDIKLSPYDRFMDAPRAIRGW